MNKRKNAKHISMVAASSDNFGIIPATTIERKYNNNKTTEKNNNKSLINGVLFFSLPYTLL